MHEKHCWDYLGFLSFYLIRLKKKKTQRAQARIVCTVLWCSQHPCIIFPNPKSQSVPSRLWTFVPSTTLMEICLDLNKKLGFWLIQPTARTEKVPPREAPGDCREEPPGNWASCPGARTPQTWPASSVPMCEPHPPTSAVTASLRLQGTLLLPPQDHSQAAALPTPPPQVSVSFQEIKPWAFGTGALTPRP